MASSSTPMTVDPLSLLAIIINKIEELLFIKCPDPTSPTSEYWFPNPAIFTFLRDCDNLHDFDGKVSEFTSDQKRARTLTQALQALAREQDEQIKKRQKPSVSSGGDTKKNPAFKITFIKQVDDVISYIARNVTNTKSIKKDSYYSIINTKKDSFESQIKNSFYLILRYYGKNKFGNSVSAPVIKDLYRQYITNGKGENSNKDICLVDNKSNIYTSDTLLKDLKIDMITIGGVKDLQPYSRRLFNNFTTDQKTELLTDINSSYCTDSSTPLPKQLDATSGQTDRINSIIPANITITKDGTRNGLSLPQYLIYPQFLEKINFDPAPARASSSPTAPADPLSIIREKAYYTTNSLASSSAAASSSAVASSSAPGLVINQYNNGDSTDKSFIIAVKSSNFSNYTPLYDDPSILASILSDDELVNRILQTTYFEDALDDPTTLDKIRKFIKNDPIMQNNIISNPDIRAIIRKKIREKVNTAIIENMRMLAKDESGNPTTSFLSQTANNYKWFFNRDHGIISATGGFIKDTISTIHNRANIQDNILKYVLLTDDNVTIYDNWITYMLKNLGDVGMALWASKNNTNFQSTDTLANTYFMLFNFYKFMSRYFNTFVSTPQIKVAYLPEHIQPDNSINTSVEGGLFDDILPDGTQIISQFGQRSN